MTTAAAHQGPAPRRPRSRSTPRSLRLTAPLLAAALAQAAFAAPAAPAAMPARAPGGSEALELAEATKTIRFHQQRGKGELGKVFALAGVVQLSVLTAKGDGASPEEKKAMAEFSAAADAIYAGHPVTGEGALASANAAHGAALLEAAQRFELPPVTPFPAGLPPEEKAALVLRAEQAIMAGAAALKAYAGAAPDARVHLKRAADAQPQLRAIRAIAFGINAAPQLRVALGPELLTPALASTDASRQALGRGDLGIANVEAATAARLATLLEQLNVAEAPQARAAADEARRALAARYQERAGKNQPPAAAYAGKDAAAVAASVDKLFRALEPKERPLRVILTAPDWRVAWRVAAGDDGKTISASKDKVLERVAVLVAGKGPQATIAWYTLVRPAEGADFGPPALVRDGASEGYPVHLGVPKK